LADQLVGLVLCFVDSCEPGIRTCACIFGLGEDKEASLEVRWPSGIVQKLANVTPDQHLVIKEAKEKSTSTPLQHGSLP
jgi:hypothetical protein